MTKTLKLKICNYSLLIFSLFTLASSIQLETTGSAGVFPVWIHVFVASIFTILVFFHIALHFKWCNWFARIAKLKSWVTKILWWLFLITVLSGVIAFAMWCVNNSHSHLGAIHGKIGFVMLAIAVGHTI